MANKPETIPWLSMGNHDSICSQVQDLRDMMAEEYPELIFGYFSETLRTHT